MSTVGIRENFMTPPWVAVMTAEDGLTHTPAGLIVSLTLLANKTTSGTTTTTSPTTTQPTLSPKLQIRRCKVHVYYFHVLLTIMLLKIN